jgi:hypothetical protein
MHGSYKNYIKIVVRNFKVRDDLGDMNVDRKIKMILKKRW